MEMNLDIVGYLLIALGAFVGLILKANIVNLVFGIIFTFLGIILVNPAIERVYAMLYLREDLLGYAIKITTALIILCTMIFAFIRAIRK